MPSQSILEATVVGDLPQPPPHSAPRSPAQSRPVSPSDNPPPSSPILYPIQTAPPFASTMSTLRRTLSSQFKIIPEDRAVHITSVNRDGFTYQYRHEADRSAAHDSTDANLPGDIQRLSLAGRLFHWLFWWPLFCLHQLRCLLHFLLNPPIDIVHPDDTYIPADEPLHHTLLTHFAKVAFCLTLTVPLNLAKHTISVLSTDSAERHRSKRTVLISGGSSIQALHLARNFAAAGYRVVCADLDGRFALTAFSDACSKYYTLPRPPRTLRSTGLMADRGNVAAYLGRLCDIVEAEQPVLYVPVSASTPAQFDALAKPHLVLRGCATFCPGAQECAVLDDLAEVLHQCGRLGMAQPPHWRVHSLAEVEALYDEGGGRRMTMHAIGGGSDWGDSARAPCYNGACYSYFFRFVELPARRVDCAKQLANVPMGAGQPWLVVAGGGRRAPGERVEELVTCTTVRESRVVANITCRQDERGTWQAVDVYEDAYTQTNAWLTDFFGRLRLQRPIEGHIAFRLHYVAGGGVGEAARIWPVGVRVGVPTAYICCTGAHPRLLWTACLHFDRQKSGPLELPGRRWAVPEAVVQTVRNGTMGAWRWLVMGGWLVGGETLFAFEDPLPCVAYCAWQLPWTLVRAWKGRPKGTK